MKICPAPQLFGVRILLMASIDVSNHATQPTKRIAGEGRPGGWNNANRITAAIGLNEEDRNENRIINFRAIKTVKFVIM